jgi:hypothetical protein
MFETEQQLSLAIIDGIEHRSEGAGFTPQRFEFIPA